MTSLQLIALVSGLLLAAVFLAVWYLNRSSPSQHTQRLVEFVSPFELAFDAVGPLTYASGYVDGKWVVFNIQKSLGGTFHIRMRTLMDFPLEVKLFFATAKQRNYLLRHKNKAAANWQSVGGYFYFEALAPYPQANEFVGALGKESLDVLDEFETQYDGLVIYDLDGTLFDKHDHLVMSTFPELREQTVLFAHIALTDKLDSVEFQRFVRDAVKLAKAIEWDMQKLFPNWKPAVAPSAASVGGTFRVSKMVKPSKVRA